MRSIVICNPQQIPIGVVQRRTMWSGQVALVGGE